MPNSFNELDYGDDDVNFSNVEKELLLVKKPKKSKIADMIEWIVGALMRAFGFLKKFQFWASAGKDMMTSEEVENFQGKSMDDLDSVIALQDGLGIESDILPEKIKSGLRSKYKNILEKIKSDPECDSHHEKINFVLGALKSSYMMVAKTEKDALIEVNKIMQKINILIKNKITNVLDKKDLTEAEKQFNKDLLLRLKDIKYKKFVETQQDINLMQETIDYNKNILTGYVEFRSKHKAFKSNLKLQQVERDMAGALAKREGVNLEENKKIVEDIKCDLKLLNLLVIKAQNGEDVTKELVGLKQKAKSLVKRLLPEQNLDINDMELNDLIYKILNEKEQCLKQYQNKVDTDKALQVANDQYANELTAIRQNFRM